MPGLAHVGSSMSLRFLAWLGSSVSVTSCSHVDYSLASRSFACSGTSTTALDFASSSPPLLVRGASRSRSRLSVAEEVFLGLSSLLHSLPHLSAFVLVSSFSHPEGSLLVRSPAHFGLLVALYGLTSLGPSLPASDFVSPSTFSLLQGCAYPKPLSLVNEEVHTRLPHVVAITRPYWCVSRGSQRFDDRFPLGFFKASPVVSCLYRCLISPRSAYP